MLPTTSGEIHRKLLKGDGQILAAARHLSGEVLEALDSSILAVFNDRAINGSPAESLRVLSSWSPDTDSGRIARSMTILSAYRAEQQSPGSSHVFLQMLSGKKVADVFSRKLVEKDLKALFSTLKDPTIESLLYNAVMQSGATGNISVNLGAVTHLSVDESAAFPVIVSPSFTNAKTLTSRKVIAYDGVIESVGQINAFLENCSKEKARVLLVARAFANEVASTIFLNNQRGNFDIVPVSPELTADGELTILDISAITGQESVSKISLENSGPECDVIIEGSTLKINLRNCNFRDDLLKKLREELSNFKEEEIRKLVGRRIARISGRRVSVCIGNEFGDTKEIAKEKFDYGMRSYLASRRRGVVEVNGKILPGDSLKSAKSAYESFTNLLRNTGGALVIDKKMEMAEQRNSKRKRTNKPVR